MTSCCYASLFKTYTGVRREKGFEIFTFSLLCIVISQIKWQKKCPFYGGDQDISYIKMQVCVCVCVCVCMHAKSFNHVPLFAPLWTVAHQSPLSMGFSRQEYWSGLPRPPSGDLPSSGSKPPFLMSSALTDGFFTTSPIWEDSKMWEFCLSRSLVRISLLY